MAITRYYSNVAVDNSLGNSGGISSGATSCYCTTTPSGYPGSYPWTLEFEPGTANAELVSVTGGAGTSGAPWTIQRGYDGTTAKSHAQSTVLGHRSSQSDFATSRAHENSGSGSGVHGLPLAAWQGASFADINETILSNSTTTVITWNAIPQTYSHLLVVVLGRLTWTGGQDGDAVCTINGDSASRYSYLEMITGTETGSLTAPSSNTAYGQTNWGKFITLAASQAGASVNAGGGFMLFPNYTGSTLNKTAYGLSGFGNGTTSAAVAKVRWCFYNPSAQAGITSISLAASAGAYQSGTFLGLYGVG